MKLEYSSVIPSPANLPSKETAKSLIILKQGKLKISLPKDNTVGLENKPSSVIPDKPPKPKTKIKEKYAVRSKFGTIRVGNAKKGSTFERSTLITKYTIPRKETEVDNARLRPKEDINDHQGGNKDHEPTTLDQERRER